MNICDKHAPLVSVRQKQRGVPWINNDYLKLARERDYFRKLFRRSKLTSYWEKFQYSRNNMNMANNLNTM